MTENSVEAGLLESAEERDLFEGSRQFSGFVVVGNLAHDFVRVRGPANL